MADFFSLLQQGVRDQIFPCGYLTIQQKGRCLWSGGIGKIPGTDLVPDGNTRFDVASLTKVVATLPTVLGLLRKEVVSLTTPIATYLPEVAQTPLGALTLHQLLTHTSGLPAYLKFYEQKEPDPLKALISATLTVSKKKAVIYSDLNFILLGLIVEAISGCDLASYCRQMIFEPHQMTSTDFQTHGAVPTRTHHAPDDQNARFFSRKVGHAGLFTTANDLIQYLDYWHDLLLQQDYWAKKAVTVQPGTHKDPRGYGWVLAHNSFGFHPNFSDQTFSHTGYTGTSILMDPVRDCQIVFLTNRVYYGTDSRFLTFRKQLHQQLFQEMRL